MAKKLIITKEFKWDCAHCLHDDKLTNEENKKIFGPCNNVHGHSYKLFVTVGSHENALVNGMIINFVLLKSMVNDLIVKRFDHTNINDDILYEDRVTTCENQIQDIWDILSPELNKMGLQLDGLKLYETSTSYAELSRC